MLDVRQALALSTDRIEKVLAVQIERAVAVGLVFLDEDTGLADAKSRIPIPDRDAIPFDDPIWDWWQAELRTVDDLKFVLRDGSAQSTALKALGQTLADPGGAVKMTAMTITRDVSLAAYSWNMPQRIIDRVSPLLTGQLKRESGFYNVEPWAIALQGFLKLGMHLHERWHDPTEKYPKARMMLRLLAPTMQKMPRQLTAPTEDALRRAEAMLTRLKVDSIRPEVQPATAGPPKKSWGAAVAFAKCFGLTLPAKLREAKGKGA